MSELIKFYKDVIGVADLTADDQGNVSGGVFLGNLTEALVDGRRLVLPTYEQLRRTDPQNYYALHPLKESVIRRGESKVMLALRTWAARRGFTTMATLLTEVLSLALDNTKHVRLSPEQATFLKPLIEVDENALKNLVDILASCASKHAQYPGMTVNIRRPGARIGMESRRVRRVAVINFPVYDRINALYEQDFGDKIKLPKGQKQQKERRIVNDVEIRVRDVALFKRLFDLIIPNAGSTDYWTVETDDDNGPSFVAFLLVMRKFITATNKVAHLFEEVFPDAEQIKYSEGWFSTLDNLQSLKAEIENIPMQDGNEGAAAEDASGIPSVQMGTQVRPVEVQAPTAAVAPVASAPVASIAPIPQTSPGVTVEVPNVVIPERPKLPPVAKPFNNAALVNSTASMTPMFVTGSLHDPNQGAGQSLYKGNRMPSVAEVAIKEQQEQMQRMLEARQQSMQQAPGMAAPAPVAAPPAPPQQIVHNGVVYQVAAPTPPVAAAPQWVMGPAGPVMVMPNSMPAPGQPLTLNHLVPQNPMMMMQPGMMNGMMNMNNPTVARNIPMFGTTVQAGPINGGMGMFPNNGGRLM